MQDKATLCWKCANACWNCSWSADFIPVNGWKAQRTTIRHEYNCGQHYDIDSYIVEECPQFKDDSERYRPNRKIAPEQPKATYISNGNKSKLRREFEALPGSVKLNRIAKLPQNQDVARMAFVEMKTYGEIASIVNRCSDSVRRLITRLVHQLAEVTA